MIVNCPRLPVWTPVLRAFQSYPKQHGNNSLDGQIPWLLTVDWAELRCLLSRVEKSPPSRPDASSDLRAVLQHMLASNAFQFCVYNGPVGLDGIAAAAMQCSGAPLDGSVDPASRFRPSGASAATAGTAEIRRALYRPVAGSVTSEYTITLANRIRHTAELVVQGQDGPDPPDPAASLCHPRTSLVLVRELSRNVMRITGTIPVACCLLCPRVYVFGATG